jgi:glycine/D-amino acid oxidase-like deaminating enzyme
VRKSRRPRSRHDAYGRGGKGITFSSLAAQLVGDLIAGASSPLLSDFALDRDGSLAR